MIDINFFKQLYQSCDDEGFIELRFLPSRKQVFVPTNDMPQINNLCNDVSQHCYFGIALRDGKGGAKNNITQIPAVHTDVDFKDTPKEMLRENLKKFPFKPSLIINSGGGVHLYWILKEPVTISEIPIVEDVNKRIVAMLNGDPNACDASRIMRIPGTLNIKYTPPVMCEVIKKDNFFYDLENFLDILPEVKSNQFSKTDTKIDKNEWLSKAMEGVSAGERNATATKIAGYWINKLSVADTLEILYMWNRNNQPPLSSKDIEIIIKSVSRYKPKVKTDLSDIYNSEKMVTAYEQHIISLKNNRFITGIDEIDKRIRGVGGGEVLTLMARAGSFKTAMLQNMLKNYVEHSAWAAVFFSLEMPVASLAERYFGLLDGCDGKSVEKMFTDIDMQKIKEVAVQEFKKDLKNLYIIPSKISIADIKKYILLIESEYNIKVGIVGIDYLGLINTHGSSEYETISKTAREIKDVAKELNLPIIVLSQTNRKGEAGQTEINLAMGRGSGAIEEAADFVLGLWQIKNEDNISLICKILKNRKGFPGSMWELDLIPETLQILKTSTRYRMPKLKKKGF